MNNFLNIQNQAEQSINNAQDTKALEEVRIRLFGKKGEVTELFKQLGTLPGEEKRSFGQKVHGLKSTLETSFAQKQQELKALELTNRLKAEAVDITIKGRKFNLGKRHPLHIVMEEIKAIFLGMGYSIARGPDIETTYYNFDALNTPAEHPARDPQDTFYVGKYVLRTQTSPVQIRTMEKGELPIKIIAPGRVFRADEVDATHSPVFHQIEGLVVDKGINMSHLKGNLLAFAKEFFGSSAEIRLRPHYFPFTEPSAEMDISCFMCEGKEDNCKVCKGEGFIELLGCGMVHRNVLEMCGIDPQVYSGFAFGMGVERIAMQKYGINDLRLFHENDMRFLDQF